MMGTTRTKIDPLRTARSMLPGMIVDKATLEVDGRGGTWLVLTSPALPEADEVKIIHGRDESGAEYVKAIEVCTYPKAAPG